jgi:Phospholipase_D-nuclease N-terminal
VGLLLCVFWIWMLVDAIQNKGLSDGEKVGWVLAIVFFHFLGSLLYFFIGRPKRLPPFVATWTGMVQIVCQLSPGMESLTGIKIWKIAGAGAGLKKAMGKDDSDNPVNNHVRNRPNQSLSTLRWDNQGGGEGLSTLPILAETMVTAKSTGWDGALYSRIFSGPELLWDFFWQDVWIERAICNLSRWNICRRISV